MSSRRRHRHRGPPGQNRAARPFIVRLGIFIAKIAIILVLGPFVLLLSVFLGFVLPHGAGGHVVTELFSRLFDRLFGPNAQEIIVSGKRHRGFLDW